MCFFGNFEVFFVNFVYDYFFLFLVSVGLNLIIGIEEKVLYKFMRNFWKEVEK